MKSVLDKTKYAIYKFQKDMKLYYGCWQTLAPIFKPSDKMYINSTDIQTTYPSAKLSYRHLRPYIVEKQVGILAYYLKLLLSIKRLYPVFNMVKLMATPKDLILSRCLLPPSNPILINEQEK